MGHPLVSVCMLTFNHEKYIGDALEALLMQDYQNIELILLDDASTDNTGSVISYYAPRLKERFVRFEHICNAQNCGNISKNVNRLLKAAQGDFIHTVSCDDVFLPHTTSILCYALIRNPQCSVVFSDVCIVPDQYTLGMEIDYNRRTLADNESGIYGGQVFFETLMIQNFIPAPAVMLKRTMFEKYGYHDEDIPYEDYEYWLRISRTELFFFINKPLVLKRWADTSLSNFTVQNSHVKLQKMIDCDYRVINKYVQFAPAHKQAEIWSSFLNKYEDMCSRFQYDEGLLFLASLKAETDL